MIVSTSATCTSVMKHANDLNHRRRSGPVATIMEYPILFKRPMVLAVLEGSKTQTRRIVDPQPPVTVLNPSLLSRDAAAPSGYSFISDEYGEIPLRCPYGRPGDRLWVKETHAFDAQVDSIRAAELSPGEPVLYCADNTVRTTGCAMIQKGRTRPSIFMPRWASRILLEVVSVRVERLQDISEADAEAEGVRNSLHLQGGRFAKENFAHLWWTINGDGSWELNPWVWVIEFRRVTV